MPDSITAARRGRRATAGPTRRIILDLPEALHEQVRQAADAERRPMTSQVQVWIEEAIARSGRGLAAVAVAALLITSTTSLSLPSTCKVVSGRVVCPAPLPGFPAPSRV